jgi:hypothetical protein
MTSLDFSLTGDYRSPFAPLATRHVVAARAHDGWGVPTYSAGDHAAFVCLRDGPTEAPMPPPTSSRS